MQPIPTATARVVVLGASNVARGIGTIVDVARETFGSPVEIIAAMGHGRSYGLTTSIPFRTLDGILHSGIWKALASRPPLPTCAVLTDIGNDLIYGCQPEKVVTWIEECVLRLRAVMQSATDEPGDAAPGLLLTGLPLASIERVGRLRFLVLRNALFPTSKLQLQAAQRYALELDAAIRQLALQHSAEFIAPSARWYGVDPIHIRVAAQREAWRTIFSALRKNIFSAPANVRSPWREWCRIMLVRPEQCRVFFRARQVAQPAVVLRDGTSISFY